MNIRKRSLNFFFFPFLWFWENKWYSQFNVYHIHFIYLFKSLVMEEIERILTREHHIYIHCNLTIKYHHHNSTIKYNHVMIILVVMQWNISSTTRISIMLNDQNRHILNMLLTFHNWESPTVDLVKSEGDNQYMELSKKKKKLGHLIAQEDSYYRQGAKIF